MGDSPINAPLLIAFENRGKNVTGPPFKYRYAKNENARRKKNEPDRERERKKERERERECVCVFWIQLETGESNLQTSFQSERDSNLQPLT